MSSYGANRFEGKVAIVTGGVSGIGTAITHRLLAEGATVVAVDVSERNIAAFLEGVEDRRRLQTRALDVTDADAVTQVFAEVVEQLGRLDVLVANAGIAAGGTAGDAGLESWHRIIAVDLDGVFHVIRAALPYLVETKGSIVNTASISGLGGDHAMAAYNAAKGGVVNLTRSAAVDFGPQGVRVNAVAPGPILTPPLRAVLDADPAVAVAYGNNIPLGRVGRTEEIAAAVAFLASDDAAYVTGVILPVDGGLTAWTGQPALNV